MANPFENLFNPSQGGTPFNRIMGTIGTAMGVPNDQQRLAKTNADSLAELSTLMESGLTPQQAFLKFVQSPKGIELISQPGFDMGSFGQSFIKNVTPPDPTAIQTSPGSTSTMFQGGKPAGTVSVPPSETQNYRAGVPQPAHNVPPGNLATDNQGKPLASNLTTEQQNRDIPKPHNVPPGNAVTDQEGRPQFRNPTENVQTFQDFTKGLAPQVVQELARLQATPGAGTQPGMLGAAVDKLVAAGSMPADIGEKIKAGIFEIKAVRGGVDNEEIGHVIIDKSGGDNTRFVPFKQNPATTPLATDPTKNSDGSPRLNSKVGMFSASGFGPALSETISSAAENLSPKAATPRSREDALNKSNLHVLDVAVQSLVANQQGLGTPKALIESLQTLVPQPGFTSPPATKALTQAITTLKMVQDEIVNEEAIMRSGPQENSKEVRVQANKRLQAYRRIERAMPTVPEMEAELERISTGGPGSSPGVSQRVGGDVGTAVKGVVQGVGDAARSGVNALGGTTPPEATPGARPTTTSPADQSRIQAVTPGSKAEADTLGRVPTMNPAQIQQALGQNPSPAILAALKARLLDLKGKQK